MGRRRMASAFARSLLSVLLVLGLAAAVVGCGDGEAGEGAVGADAVGENRSGSRLVLASTTSTEDSGLFDVLIPAFESARPGYEVEVVAVGTGAALALGRAGDADVLLVHARSAEEQFVADRYGTERRDVMYNDFVIAGPSSDPAGLGAANSAVDALVELASSGTEFVSRGDDSGTHVKERSLWEAAGVRPGGDWYLEAGQGMGDCLTMASEREAYVLTDRATFLNMAAALELEIAFEGDPALLNQYGVVPVAAAANPAGAAAFVEWIVGEEAQALIGAHGIDTFGQALFVPNAR